MGATIPDLSDTVASLTNRSDAVDDLVRQLAEQNKKLKADLLKARQQIAKLSGDDDSDSDDDDRAFGTHLRQAWAILRGK